MKSMHMVFPPAAVLAIAGCALTTPPSEEAQHTASIVELKLAASESLTPEQRAVLYLNAARKSLPLLDNHNNEAIRVHNDAAAKLTILLRAARNGAMWDRPLTLTHGGTTYRLHFTKGTHNGIWDPAYFTSYLLAEKVGLKTIDRRNHQDGIGGALVGVRKTNSTEPFTTPTVGVTAPVTAVLDFKDLDVTLTLIDPATNLKARIAGKNHTPHADFTAPLAHYPHTSELWESIMGAVRITPYPETTGLYMLQPYDPNRIPLIFVHGLMSTPRKWRNVINELETDPTLRGRYQCWVFVYPTGNPPLHSALRLREGLEELRRLHPDTRDHVLVGHSMGGLISRAQVTTLNRSHWDVIGSNTASRLFANVKPGSIVARATTFSANPHIDRTIFICTPHRGSKMAIGGSGELAIRLISLPIDLTTTLTAKAGNPTTINTGDPNQLPDGIVGLSPLNPTLKVLETRPIEVPHHSIIGDGGKGDSPNSTDGVVDYWSSHLITAQSERIVPGFHGACELPETLDELRRILHLHLDETANRRAETDPLPTLTSHENTPPDSDRHPCR